MNKLFAYLAPMFEGMDGLSSLKRWLALAFAILIIYLSFAYADKHFEFIMATDASIFASLIIVTAVQVGKVVPPSNDNPQ